MENVGTITVSAEQNDALNDAVAAVWQEATPTATDYIDALVQARKDWEDTLLHASNQGLYGLLAKCMRVYNIMTQADEQGAKLRDDFDAYIKNAKLKFDGATHTVVKIARVVFDNDRKKASAYGYALRAAVRDGIAPEALAAYITNKGGVEKLRMTDEAVQHETMQDKAIRAWSSLQRTRLAVAQGTELSKACDMANIGKRVVLLATQLANGEFAVHAVVQADSVVNHAYAAQAPEMAKAQANTQDAAVAKQNDLAKARAEAVKAALG